MDRYWCVLVEPGVSVRGSVQGKTISSPRGFPQPTSSIPQHNNLLRGALNLGSDPLVFRGIQVPNLGLDSKPRETRTKESRTRCGRGKTGHMLYSPKLDTVWGNLRMPSFYPIIKFVLNASVLAQRLHFPVI